MPVKNKFYSSLIALCIVLFFSCFNRKNDTNTALFIQQLQIDFTKADTCNLSRFEIPESLNVAVENFERDIARFGMKTDYRKYLRVIFRYRDKRLLPLFVAICNDTSLELIHRVRAINVMGAIGDSTCEKQLLQYTCSTNHVIREYAVNALGKCGTVSVIDDLLELQKTERNRYVITTIETAVNRIYGKTPPPLCRSFFYDASGYTKNAFLFNPNLIGNDKTHSMEQLEGAVIQPVSKDVLIYPHQQYKMNPETIYNWADIWP